MLETISILHGVKSLYEKHHRVIVTDKAIKAAADLSVRYVTDRSLPDKAIDLMDEASARVRMKLTTTPPDLKAMQKEIRDLQIKKEEAIANQDYETAASFRDKEKKLKDKYVKEEMEWRDKLGATVPEVDEEHIAEIVGILLKDVQKRLGDEELTLKLTETASAFLVKHGYDEKFGARPLKRAIQKYIEDPLSEKILLAEFAKGDEIEVDLAADGEKLEFRVLSGTAKA